MGDDGSDRVQLDDDCYQHRQPVFLVEFNSALARHQLTFYHPHLTETNSVAWLVRATSIGGN